MAKNTKRKEGQVFMKSTKFNGSQYSHILRVFLTLLIIGPIPALAMNNDPETEKKQHTLMVKKWGEDVLMHKTKLQRPLETVNQERNIQALFDSYMQKAVHHYHLGERDNQLACYKEILIIPALSDLDIARTHVNISNIHLQLGRILLAAAHLTKAETLTSIKDIEAVMGPQTFSLFATIYHKAADELYPNAPEQALIYYQKAFQLPEQAENFYGFIHLNLSVCYDRLLKSKDSLNHALQALNFKSLTQKSHDRALCFAAIGSKDTDKPEDCLRYFIQIKSLKDLIYTERYLVLSAVARSYCEKENLEQGFIFGHRSLEALDPHSPQYLIAKYGLAVGYGEYGNRKKELELYNEVLESIRDNTFEVSWQKSIQSIQMSIETVFFMKEMKKFEKRLIENLHQKTQEEIEEQQKNKKEEKEKMKQQKEKNKEKRHQQLIETIKATQRKAVEREKRLAQEKLQRLENEKKSVEERKNRILSEKKIPKELPEFPSSSESTHQIPDKIKPKIKARGKAVPQETSKDEIQVPQSIAPALPLLGTRAQIVFDQIKDEDWNFIREEYTYYLEDLQCVRRENGSSHRVFQLPKTTTLTLKKDGQEIQEEVFLADDDIKLGSVTLPGWKEKTVPFYLRRQIRNFHEKIIKIYTKVAKMSTVTNSNK